MQIDHIRPESRGGTSDDDHLCWCCGECNTCKGDATAARDPLTGELVSPFHPQAQDRADRFVWGEDGALIQGTTPVGRATVAALRLKRPWLVYARRRWTAVGWHPPARDRAWCGLGVPLRRGGAVPASAQAATEE